MRNVIPSNLRVSPLSVVSFKTFIGALAFLVSLSIGWGLIGIHRTPRLTAETPRSPAEGKVAENSSRITNKTADPIVMVINASTSLKQEDGRSRENEFADQHELNLWSDATAFTIQPQNENFLPRLVGPERNPILSTNPAITLLEMKLEDASRELEVAELEKALLLDEIEILRERKKIARPGIRGPSDGAPAISGKVLAFNRTYNFAVLSLGAVNGVEINSEMLVFRGRSFICKIRISSVEPAMAIGDIITNSLGNGAHVRIGDTVIYAGKDP